MHKFKFFQWLNVYERITKREYKELSKQIQEKYLKEYQMFLKGK